MAGEGFGRSPTFVVGSERQRGTLDSLVRREQHFDEAYQKNKPLCFNAKAFQKTHPVKARKGQSDADATLCSPMLVAIADGVSQIEEFGIDASELPNELLNNVEELAVSQLLPGQETDEYCGPITMMREAYEATESLGSTTVLTAIMDNSTKIHGKLHPMIAVCSIGDCEILILRRASDGYLQSVFHTEMQRIDGNAQSPLQLARVDDSVDPDFDPSIAIEVIERGSAVHCVSAFEGDIVILGSDGVFDNLFIDEIVSLVQGMLGSPDPAAKFKAVDRHRLGAIAKRLVLEAHAKTQVGPGGYRQSPIGPGGKIDDTSCVVAQVVEWTEAHGEAWAEVRQQRGWRNLFTCGGQLPSCEDEVITNDFDDIDDETGTRQRNYPSKPNANSFSTYWGSFSETRGGGPSRRPPPSLPSLREQRREEYSGCQIM
jgi:protein phosphatase PTC7|mmetsp:Transcript_55352/g.87781  ORF Transcript_55352/g.87781 Transcript_55352/m.87781 type:complete len:429 (-) Transcript_55352:136-1422(-)